MNTTARRAVVLILALPLLFSGLPAGAQAQGERVLRSQVQEETLVLTDSVAEAEAQVARYPGNPEAHFLLAMAYSRTPYFEKAFFAARKAKQLIKKSSEGYALFDRRIADYEFMRDNEPGNTAVLYRLAFAYFMKGYALEKGYIKNTPETPTPYYRQAEETLNAVISLDPGDVWAKNYLGFLLVDMDEAANLDRAIALWESSLAANPINNPGAYLLLGEAYLKRGNLKRAVEMMNQGLAGRQSAPDGVK